MGYPYAVQGYSRKAGITYSQSNKNRGRCPSPKRHRGRNNVLGGKYIPEAKECGQGVAGYVHSGWNEYGQRYRRRRG